MGKVNEMLSIEMIEQIRQCRWESIILWEFMITKFGFRKVSRFGRTMMIYLHLMKLFME